MKITKHLRIHGRVQGVYFRESMRLQALQLGVTGWVRNRGDGTVEATVQGETSRVEQMIEWARRGPPAAAVERVEVSDADGEYPSFEKTASV